MSEFAISDTSERIFLLSTIEFAAAVFRGPDRDGWEGIISVGLPQLVAASNRQSPVITAILKKIQAALSSDTPDQPALLQTEYERLFTDIGTPAVAPLQESCQLEESPRIRNESAVSMRSRLINAGLDLPLNSSEPPDHLSIELEYLYHRLATGWSESDPEIESQARKFARCTMLPWLRHFRRNLALVSPHPVYLGTADLTVAILEAIR
ncbi:molecular chaperone TorD family protein [uncultured Pseudodesulfovibrio sp.]|uniref:TorD/DmsD family molecular chaperone n=1 Tax=uncultured Pseudodesulfovibrio sp. TaxID=2035858 RepID=UPI0029C86F68|nr:molecular chaperone TorD family protein [uncultured Pseudodesulfovibrio sp.]